MKKRVIGGVVLMLAGSLLFYLWPRQPPDDVLDRMGEILGKLEEMYEGEYIHIIPFFTKPDDLDGEKVQWIRSRMREAGLDRVSLSCYKNSCLSVYYIGNGFFNFGNSMYYKYDSDDLFEEIIVDSVEKAIEENTEVNYAFCERTEAEHWFYCENNH
ncbi:hypothetical protein [Halomonas sp. BN3-1]|uniref:hypothetical protein n=1 Tax=Halomonas sp. BN3-1 TaxID=2082393 RepID=UPI000D388DE4|nr:hypothetical protein [Halomonas sp. BN3-1]